MLFFAPKVIDLRGLLGKAPILLTHDMAADLIEKNLPTKGRAAASWLRMVARTNRMTRKLKQEARNG